jgi:transposase-like protein
MSKPCRPDLLTALLRLLVMRAKPAVDAAAQRAAAIEAPAVHHMSVRCPLCGAFGAELGPNGQFSCESCGREGTLRRDQFIDLG